MTREAHHLRPDHEHIAELAKSGLTNAQIAERVGLSPYGIKRALQRMKNAGVTLDRPHQHWTPEMDDRLIRLWGEGLSAGQIAAEFSGLTRSAIIGRANRLRANGFDIARRERVENPKVKLVKLPKKPRQLKLPKLRILPPTPVESLSDPVSNPLKLHLWGMTNDQCRFVCDEKGEDGFARFCGHQTHNNTAWCAAHYRIVYRPPIAMKPVAEKVAA